MSDIFDLDPDNAKYTEQWAQSHPMNLQALTTPGAFGNFFVALGTDFMKGGALTANTVGEAFNATRNLNNPTPWDFGPNVDVLHPPAMVQKLTASKHDVLDVTQDAVHYWTPDPLTTGSASRMIGGVMTMAVPMMLTGGTSAGGNLLALNSYVHTSNELTREGVDAKTAERVSAISALTNLIGFKLPGHLGNTMLSRVASGIGINVGLGGASDASTAAILRAGGYDKLAKNYDWANAEHRGMDVLMGAVFGLRGHYEEVGKERQIKRINDILKAEGIERQRNKDALLTQLNADHFQSVALSIDNADPGAQLRGEKALGTAINQSANGEPVHVADMLRPSDVGLTLPEAGSVIDQRLEALDELAKGERSKGDLATAGKEAGDLEDLLREEYAKRQSGVKLSPDKHLSDEELAQAEGLRNGRLAELEGHRQAVAAKNAAAKLRKKLGNIDNDDELRRLAENVAGIHSRYTRGIAPRKEGEDDKAYAKRVIDKLPAPEPDQLPDQPDLYFTDTDVSATVPLNKLKSSKSAAENKKGGNNGLKRMAAAADGVIGKRAPIKVHDNGDGTYTVLDGNGTLTAARKAGFEGIPVRVESATVPGRPDVQARYDAAAKAYPEYVKTMQALADAVGGRFVNPGLKHVHRLLAKVDGPYKGDVSRVADMVRGTIEMPSPGDVPATVATLHEKFGDPVKPERNNLMPDSPPLDASGYRDYKGVFDINGTPSEVQINIPLMLEAKEKGHVPYEARQKIEGRADKEDRDLTDDEINQIAELNAEMRAFYEPAWALATSERKSFSQSGTPSSRNRLPENRVGGNELQSSVTPVELETGAPSTSPNVVRGGNEPGNARNEGAASRSAMAPATSGVSAIGKSSTESIADMDRTTAAATTAVDASPDMLIPLEDGTTITAREAMAKADDVIAQAEQDAKGFEAAVNCGLRHI